LIPRVSAIGNIVHIPFGIIAHLSHSIRNIFLKFADIVALKTGKQHQQVVQHGIYQDALYIHSKYGKVPTSELAMETQCTEQVVVTAYLTIEYMMNHGYSDKRMHDSYFPLSMIVKAGMSSCVGIASASKWQSALYTHQWQEAGITLDAVIDRMTSVKSNQWRTRDVATRLAKYGNLKTPHKYDITIVRAFLNGTDGCDTPHGWKEYAKLVEAREKDEVTPKSEIANVRRCKTNLEGTTRRMHMMLNCDTNDVRFSDEQILSMFDDVSSLQKSIGLLSDTLNQLMRRSYASKSVASSQSA
jgi:hypothetical protein